MARWYPLQKIRAPCKIANLLARNFRLNPNVGGRKLSPIPGSADDYILIIYSYCFMVKYHIALYSQYVKISLRWRFSTHAGIHGCSCMIVFLQCGTRNRSENVFTSFVLACEAYEILSRVHGDCGGENFPVNMNNTISVAWESYITGRSVYLFVWMAWCSQYFSTQLFTKQSFPIYLIQIITFVDMRCSRQDCQ